MTSDPGTLSIGLAAIASFVAAFHFSGLVARVREGVAVTHQALSILADKTLDDAAKERLIRRSAISLFGHSFQIALTALCVLIAPALVVCAGDLTGLAPFAATSDFLLHWEVVASATGVAIVVWIIRR